MRRMHFGFLAASLPVLALSLALVGCGGGTDTTPSGDKKTDSSKPSDPKAEAKWIEPGKGTITGKVTLKGDPAIAKKNAALMEEINKNPNKTFCLSGPKEDVEEQVYVVGADKGLANVVVFLMPEDTKNTFFKIADVEAWGKKEVDFDQPHCAFHPHVAIAFPTYVDPANTKKHKDTGEKVVVKNSAPEAHNTNYKNESGSYAGGNLNLQPKSSETMKDLPPSYTEPVKLKCNIHGWMTGYLWAFDHPYAAVTDKDGNYKIENVPTTLPSGVKLRIVAWHESASFINTNKGEDFEPKDKVTKDFEVTAKND